MSTANSVKVSGRFQISLPSRTRRELGIEAGDRLLLVVRDGVIVLLPQPSDFVEYSAGLHREVWEGMDTAAYLKEERAAWQISNVD